MVTTIRKAIDIKAPMAHVWQFIGTEAGLRQWWQTAIVLEAKQGGYCEEHSTMHSEVYIRRGVVTAYEPPRQLTLTFPSNGDADRAQVMTISITLHEKGGVTQVRITQQLSGVVPPQLPWAREKHDDDPTTPSAPIIVNQLQPMSNAIEHGGGHAKLPVGGAVIHTDAVWDDDLACQWTQRLATLRELMSGT